MGESRYSGSCGIFAFGEEPVELPDDLLGAPDRERRDEQDPVVLGDEPDRLGQDPDRLFLGLVLAAAVGRLDQDVIRVA